MHRCGNYDNKTEDKFFKELFSEYYKDVFKAIGINIDLDYIYSEEFRQLEEVTLIPDFMGKDKDGVTVLVEFQSTMPTKQRLCEMIRYIANEMVKNGGIVDPYIICTVAEQNKIIEVPVTRKDSLQFTMISLKEINGDKTLNKIKEKVKNNEELSKEDEIFLSLIPFTDLSMPIDDAIVTAIKLTNKAKSLEIDRKNVIKNLQSTISKKLAPTDIQEVVRRELKMYNDFFREEIEEAERIAEKRGEKIGKRIGEEIGELKSAERISERMRAKGLSEDFIQQIVNY